MSQHNICFRLLNFTSKVANKIPFSLLVASNKDLTNSYAQWIFFPFLCFFSLCILASGISLSSRKGFSSLYYVDQELLPWFAFEILSIAVNQETAVPAAVLCVPGSGITESWRGALLWVLLWNDGLAFPAGQLLELIRLCLRA